MGIDFRDRAISFNKYFTLLKETTNFKHVLLSPFSGYE